MVSALGDLASELAALQESAPLEAAKALLRLLQAKLDAAIAGGTMADVQRLADELAQQAEPLAAVIAGDRGRHDAASAPTDPETFEV